VAKPLTIRIDGLDSTFAKLNDQVDEIKFQIDNEMAAAVENMATSAKQLFPLAPKKEDQEDYSQIRSSIRTVKNKDFDYELIAGYGTDPKNPQDALAAYIEFGTGKFFKLYPGKEKLWQDLADQYYLNGNGWTRPSPYFYPSVKTWYQSLISNIQRLLNKNERL
jgi:hypothetical protein